jgi:Xaa-Pro aminopeptidase
MNRDERLAKVRQAMERQEVDLLFLTPSAGMQYLTGIHRDRPNFGNVTYPGGWVFSALIGREKGPVVVAPRMVAEFDLPEAVRSGVRVLPEQGDPFAFMGEVLREFGTIRRIAVENRAWAEAVLGLQELLPAATFTRASDIIAPLRMIKDDDEIATMRHAAHIADQVMAAVFPRLKIGMSELDVALEVDMQQRRLGSEGPSFTTNIFMMGPGLDRDVREKVSERTLVAGLSLSFDFGCVYEGYCSDFGRTVHIGEPPAEFRRAYDAVIGGQQAAIRAMKSGQITAEGANAVARAVIDDAGFGQHFRHRLGHGIGLDVHEGPFLTVGDTTTLQTGMAFTVEPSVFWPGHIGTRVEDVVIVRPDGGENLNETGHELRVVS